MVDKLNPPPISDGGGWGGERADWSYPTTVRFGAGRIAELPEVCAEAGIKRPLFVTDSGLSQAPITARTLDLLKKAGMQPSLFCEVESNPGEKHLAAGVAAFCAGGHDGVVAFGGGSGLDLGKLTAFMARQERPVWDFEDIGDCWKLANPAVIAPIIAVPTTAGTGSEVGRAGVLTNPATNAKKIIFHPKMLPATAICDPELTVAMPRAITAGTGMDAFAHCLEAFCAPSFHPMSAGIALEGMRLARENLPRVCAEPGDIPARARMMAAAAMGAVAFQKGLGAIHALSHPVGALYDTHHGTTNAVVMPAVLLFNRAAIAGRIGAVAAYMGIGGGFDGFLAEVMRLREAAGIPKTLGAMGVAAGRIGEMAKMAVQDPTAAGNPVPLTVAAAESLYRECL